MKEETKDFWRQWGRNLWAIRMKFVRQFLLLAAYLGIKYLYQHYGEQVYQFSKSIIGAYYTKLLIGALVILLGWLAYRFKRASQWWYGILEVIFGAVTGLSVAFGINGSPTLAQTTSILSCVYVIARGLNNIHDAKVKETMVVA